ncbi:MAG: FtsW/RodA/SpoVE family cell cycle protein [Angelakisella sp.]|nr:FtsW/RodA/SpoVE family cell cycle protein [Angelakisella sp.]
MKFIGRFIKKFYQSTDKSIWVVALGLTALSVLLLTGIYECGYVQKRTVEVQIIAAGIGVVAAIIAASFDPEDLAGLWKLYVPPVVLLMVMTYFMGTIREGSTNKSWLDLGFVSIQPSEFLKIAFILTFSLHLSKVKEDINEPHTLFWVLVHGAVPVGMVLLQKDAGVALIVAFIMVSMLFAAGIAGRYIAMAAGALVVALPVLWFGILSEYQKLRIMVLFDPEHDPLGITYQQNRGLTAIGSGQIFGIGVFNENHIYVPENYNDFIFTFLGESFGFVGCLLVIVALAYLCGKILHTAIESRSSVGRFVCVGVFAMIAFQAVINIGMCLMVMPVIGITLPLLSGGGSSVLSVYIGLGMVLGVYADSNRNMFIK